MSTQPSALAPGARVLIRDAEWIVKRVDPTGTGGRSVQVVGVSEIVRHKEARFLTEIEGKGITVLDPAETELVPDTSPQYRNSRLYLESLLRRELSASLRKKLGQPISGRKIPQFTSSRWQLCGAAVAILTAG